MPGLKGHSNKHFELQMTLKMNRNFNRLRTSKIGNYVDYFFYVMTIINVIRLINYFKLLLLLLLLFYLLFQTALQTEASLFT